MENSEQPMPTRHVGEKEDGIEISFTKDEAHISFPHLHLSTENSTSPEVQIVVEKQPIEVTEGKSYCVHGVLVDQETEKMQNLVRAAEKIQILPENERPAKILDIFTQNLYYAYNDVIEKLSETDPDKAKWVAENTSLNAHVSDVPLSKLVENSYGVCRHLAVAYLWLAQKAGLQGVLLHSERGMIKNIKRSDTNQKLFRSAEIGGDVMEHVWVEIKTSDGRWIPVDPSTKLAGDSESGLAMFKEAGYISTYNEGISFDSEPNDQLSIKEKLPISFKPAEAKGLGIYSLELKSTKPIIRRVGKEHIREELPPTNIPYSGPGKLNITTNDQFGLAWNIEEVKECAIN